MKKLIGISLLLTVLGCSATAMACPTNCLCDATGKIIQDNRVNINSGNRTTNINKSHTTVTHVNSDNTDKSIHANGGAGGEATQQQKQEQEQEAVATANNDGSGNGNTVRVEGDNVHIPRAPVNTAYAAALTSGYDTCLGSMSGGAQTAPVGVTFGGTKTDQNCVFIKKAHLLAEPMSRVECFFIRQHDKDIDEAFKAAGMECPLAVPVVIREPANMSIYVTRDELNEHDRRELKHVGK
jgi:hypothetical protein